MGWQSDAAAAAAQRLNDQGIGVWAPTGTGGNIYRGTIPPDLVPAIGVQTYRVGPDDPANANTQVRIQFWLRAATIADLDDLDSAIYDAFHGLHGAAWGSAILTDCRSFSSVPQGVDGNGNYERACNYTADLDLPSTALRAN